VNFDCAGAPDGIYTGTLYLRSRDQQDLDGAIDLPELSYDLVATVEAGISGAPAVPGAVVRTGLISMSPNPFESGTEISFGLEESTRVRLEVFDVSGRLVRTLRTGIAEAGIHRVAWRGTDESGLRLGVGVYFVRLQTRDSMETRAVILLR
jgi:hypothetical protein